jgi:hypothetical protein
MDTIEIVNAVRDGHRLAAVDKIADILYGKASEAMGDYKQIVARSFFDSTEEDVEFESPEEETEE